MRYFAVSVIVHDEISSNLSFQKGILEGWLHSTGRLPPWEGWPMIAGCRLGVALLRPIGNYIESYLTKMFEYMAMGIPVLVSDFPLYRKVVERYECGLCVDPENVQEVKRALMFFYENPDRSKEMGLRGRKAVLEKFNWEFEKTKLIGFYKGIIQGG